MCGKCTRRHIVKDAEVKGHPRPSGATNFIKKETSNFLLTFETFRKTVPCKIILYLCKIF